MKEDDVAGRAAARVRAEYARRSQDETLRRYYKRNRLPLERASAERRAITLRQIDRLGPRERTSVLDVGCGFGTDLAFLASQGLPADRLAGVDLLDERVAAAREAVPGADVRMGNAAELPHGDASFDVALQSVVLSSVTDAGVRSLIAAEMARVVRPGGLLISYDMRRAERGNPELVPIEEHEVQRLFGTFGAIDIRTLTLNIGLASRVGPFVARILDRLPVLRTHLLAVVTVSPRR